MNQRKMRAGKERIAKHIYLTRAKRGKPVTMKEARELVDEVFDAMYLALANGFPVVFSNFGSLTPTTRENFKVRDLQTGDTKVVEKYTRVRWTSAPRLKAVVNGRTKVFTVRKASKSPRTTIT